MHLTVSPGLIVHRKNLDFFRQYFWSYVQLKFENFSKTLLFECLNFSKTLLFQCLNFSKTLLFCSFIIFKRTQGTSYHQIIFNLRKQTSNGLSFVRPFGN